MCIKKSAFEKMNWKSFSFVSLIFLSFGVQAASAGRSRDVPVVPPVSLPTSGFADVISPVISAVVNISTVTHVKKAQGSMDLPQFPPGSPFEDLFRDFLDQFPFERSPRQSKVVSLGSGFVIDSSGYIVTNAHVVADADQITVMFNDNTKLQATLVGKDARTDLALLKVKSPKPLSFVSWGDGHKVRVGDWVFAIGNPYGLGGTVTKGIISHIGRDISSKIGANYIDGYFQTDAAINMGNSGGPLFSMDGRVIGINTVIYSPTGGNIGIGFSIPVFIAQPVIEQLKKFGRTKRGWIGVRFQQMDQEIADSVGLPRLQGALVGSVVPRGPAEKAKVEQGDIILKVNGIAIEDSKKLPRIIGTLPIGSVVSVVIWRKDRQNNRYREIPLHIKIEEYEEAEDKGLLKSSQSSSGMGSQDVLEVAGMKMAVLTPQYRQKFKLSEKAQGVLIVSVAPDSMAEEKGISPGDLVLEVGHEEVSSPDEVAEKIQKARAIQQRTVLLLIAYREGVRFVSLRIDGEAGGIQPQEKKK